MERIAPLYGQDDSTVLLIDSEQTLLDDPREGARDETTLLTRQPDRTVAPNVADHSIAGLAPAWQSIATRSGHNPLMIASHEILLFGIELSELERDAPMQRLRQRAVQQVKMFEVRGQSLGLTKPVLLAARYLLCTFLDEMVVTSPWGGAHEWTQESLLSQFHGETYGGQGFFTILQRACEEPQKNLDLLELIFAILSLGFEGKYRVDADGQRKLESLRDMIMALIQRGRGDQRPSLCVGEQGARPAETLTRSMPWQALLLGAVASLCILHGALYSLLDQSGQDVTQGIEKLSAPLASSSKQSISSL